LVKIASRLHKTLRKNPQSMRKFPHEIKGLSEITRCICFDGRLVIWGQPQATETPMAHDALAYLQREIAPYAEPSAAPGNEFDQGYKAALDDMLQAVYEIKALPFAEYAKAE
jgi:hypothetical protein